MTAFTASAQVPRGRRSDDDSAGSVRLIALHDSVSKLLHTAESKSRLIDQLLGETITNPFTTEDAQHDLSRASTARQASSTNRIHVTLPSMPSPIAASSKHADARIEAKQSRPAFRSVKQWLQHVRVDD